MRFHFPSFVIGFGTGVATTLVAKQLRPVAVELASLGFQAADAVSARIAVLFEDWDDVVAEARARARGEDLPEDEPMAESA